MRLVRLITKNRFAFPFFDPLGVRYISSDTRVSIMFCKPLLTVVVLATLSSATWAQSFTVCIT